MPRVTHLWFGDPPGPPVRRAVDKNPLRVHEVQTEVNVVISSSSNFGRLLIPGRSEFVDDDGVSWRKTYNWRDNIVGELYFNPRETLTLKCTGPNSTYCHFPAIDEFEISDDERGAADDDANEEPLIGGWSEDKDWVDYMKEREEKRVDPDSVHEQQAGLKDFRDAKQSDVNPDAIDQSDDRLDSLPAFLDDDEFESVSKFAPGTGTYGECDHCNSEDWWSHPLESGIDALRPGGIKHGDPDNDPCHADKIKGCDCDACPRCSGLSIEFRVKSQDYRCNNCDLRFSHPVPAPSEFDGERGKLYWRCKHCGRECQAAFVGIPEALLDAAPQSVFDC